MPKRLSIDPEVLSLLWETREAMLLYIYMAINADGSGNFIVPPSRKFAEAVGMTRYALDKGLRALIKFGLINQYSTNIQPNSSHIITLNPKALSAPLDQFSTKLRPDFNQDSAAPAQIAQDGYGRFLEYFNNKVGHTPIKQIRTLSDARKKALRSIFKEFGGKEVVEEVLEKVVRSQWCCGINDKGWVASFDWIFKKANFIKILEGNYDNRSTPIITTDNAASRKAQRDRGLSLATTIVARSENLLSLFNGGGADSNDSQD